MGCICSRDRAPRNPTCITSRDIIDPDTDLFYQEKLDFENLSFHVRLSNFKAKFKHIVRTTIRGIFFRNVNPHPSTEKVFFRHHLRGRHLLLQRTVSRQAPSLSKVTRT